VPYTFKLTPSSAVHSTNPVRSLDNSTISGTVWWADGRPLLYVVLWLRLSAVLHYSWMVIRLTALQWKEGWTKPPPEPIYSKECAKHWKEYSWLFKSIYNDHSSQQYGLGLYCNSAEYDDTDHALTLFKFVLFHEPPPRQRHRPVLGQSAVARLLGK